jgi:hypothetical protein
MTCSSRLGQDLAVDARTNEFHLLGPGTGQRPVVQALTAVAEPIAGSRVGPGDEPVEGHGHVANGC